MTLELLEKMVVSEVENLHFRIDTVVEQIGGVYNRLDRIDHQNELLWMAIDDLRQTCATKQDLEILRRQIREDLQQFATKEDLRLFASKDDLLLLATKNDLRAFATKNDLRSFATKKDLGRFATKEDLSRFATKKDLHRFATKEDLSQFVTNERFDEALSLLRQIMQQLGVSSAP